MQPPQAQLIRKIVVGYDLMALPPYLIRGFTLLRARLERKRFQIEVLLRPLTDLPADTDLLFVAAGFADAARQVAPAGTRVIALDKTGTQQSTFDALVEQLELGQEVCALFLAEGAKPGLPVVKAGNIVRYRGYEQIG